MSRALVHASASVCVFVCNVCLSSFLDTACGGGEKTDLYCREESKVFVQTRPEARAVRTLTAHYFSLGFASGGMLCVAPRLSCEKRPSKALSCTLLAYLAGAPCPAGMKQFRALSQTLGPNGTGVGVPVAASPIDLNHSNSAGIENSPRLKSGEISNISPRPEGSWGPGPAQ